MQCVDDEFFNKNVLCITLLPLVTLSVSVSMLTCSQSRFQKNCSWSSLSWSKFNNDVQRLPEEEFYKQDKLPWSSESWQEHLRDYHHHQSCYFEQVLPEEQLRSCQMGLTWFVKYFWFSKYFRLFVLCVVSQLLWHCGDQYQDHVIMWVNVANHWPLSRLPQTVTQHNLVTIFSNRWRGSLSQDEDESSLLVLLLWAYDLEIF